MKRFVLLAAACLAITPKLSAQIYADFVTSLGNFTCDLNYTASPKTVANFVGLADGSRTWIDPASGALRQNTPFYNGLIFHRVVQGFVDQAGSPNGTGSDGPGYVFIDETNNGLTPAPYIIAMANAGNNTNGSQFFLTAGSIQPGNINALRGLYTIFGSVTSGTAVIDAINNTPTVSEKPVTPVVISSVTIRRVGATALAFNAQSQGLPILSNIIGRLNAVPGTKVEVIPAAARTGGTTTNIYRTEDLQTWQQSRSFHLGKGGSNASALQIEGLPLDGPPPAARAFYRFTKVEYPDSIVPQSMASRVLKASWGTLSIQFNYDSTGNSGTAVYSGDGNVRNIVQVYSTNSPYDWIVSVDDFGPLKISGSYSSETSTLISGIQKISQWSNGSWNFIGEGTLTLTK